MNTLIVEDSRLARDGLARMLSPFTQLGTISVAENAKQARQIIEKLKPELLFLDVNLPGENGFELLESLDYEPDIIFTTAYADYAIRSFDHSTIDYLLKPISQERLQKAIEKLNQTQPAPSEKRLAPEDQLFIKDGDNCYLIQVNDIEYFESCKNYTRVFFKGRNAFIRKPISQIELRLPLNLFIRASRQYLVNLKHCTSIEETIQGGFCVHMPDNSQIDISRRSSIELKRLLSL